MTSSHSASVMEKSIRSRRIPALLTTTWSPPKVSMACRTMAWPPSQVPTSSVLATAVTASGRDLVDHLLGRPGVAARSVAGTTHVVDDDLRTVLREQERVLAADAAAGTGDDAHPVGTADVVHVDPRFRLSSLLPKGSLYISGVAASRAGGAEGDYPKRSTLSDDRADSEEAGPRPVVRTQEEVEKEAPPDEAVHIVLPGAADRSHHLVTVDRGRGHCPPGREVRCRRRARISTDPGRAGDRPCGLQIDVDVGQAVLHRLERPQRHAELPCDPSHGAPRGRASPAPPRSAHAPAPVAPRRPRGATRCG